MDNSPLPLTVRILALLLPIVILPPLCAACGDDDDPAPAPPDAGVNAAPPPPPATTSDGSAPIVVDCPIGSAVELEANDTPETATAFTDLMFCGVLTTAKDVDYATFVVPEGKKLTVFQAIVEGKVEFEIAAGGKKFAPGETENYVGGRYLVKMFTKGTEPAKYRFRIQFD
jgi:hypothetical protein